VRRIDGRSHAPTPSGAMSAATSTTAVCTRLSGRAKRTLAPRAQATSARTSARSAGGIPAGRGSGSCACSSPPRRIAASANASSADATASTAEDDTIKVGAGQRGSLEERLAAALAEDTSLPTNPNPLALPELPDLRELATIAALEARRGGEGALGLGG